MKVEPKYDAVEGTFYVYDNRLSEQLTQLRQRVYAMRHLVKTLSEGASLQRIQEYFRLKNIYNSNAIEGNRLSMGETKLVIEQGLTITGKPLKDSVEAKNLSDALDFFEELADRDGQAITTQDIKNINALILRGIDDQNAGKYRNVFVEISGSEYRPPDPAELDGMMSEFGDWLQKISGPVDQRNNSSTDPIVLACAAHAWFVYIHPFIDGNGRTARLLMNLLLLRYDYPLTILTKDDRQRYYDALEESQTGDLTPFIQLVLESAWESIEVYEQAAKAQLDIQQFVQTLVLEEENKLRNEYEVFKSAMQLLKGYFRQTIQPLDEQMKDRGIGIGFKDFGVLEFEKYQSLRRTQSAKKTWFFRITLYTETESKISMRYLMFFGFASHRMSGVVGENEVTLHTATETYPYYYERLANLDGNDLPDILEISYLPKEERFVYLDRDEQIHKAKAEEIAIIFIEQAFKSFN